MSKRIKLYTDEHVPNSVVKGLRLRGIDVLTTKEAAMLGAEDQAHLEFAAEEQRVIFTQDDDFLRLHAVVWNIAESSMPIRGLLWDKSSAASC